jgi:hypothetical protein
MYLSGIFEEVEKVIPGIRALAFTDDVAWWVEGKDDREVAARLGTAAETAIGRGERNGIAFDQEKTTAVLFSRSGTASTARIRVGDREVERRLAVVPANPVPAHHRADGKAHGIIIASQVRLHAENGGPLGTRLAGMGERWHDWTLLTAQ